LRLGILGGAFNPPHIGHLVCAQEAVVQLELEKVLFVPTGVAPHREIEDDPGGDARFEMCEAAIDGDERFEASRIELEREGPSYTSETLKALHSQSPKDELFLLLGGDQAAALPRWHEPEAVLEGATLAVVERVGYTRNTIAIQLARLRAADRVRYIDMPLMQVSSTSIRRRVAEGKPIRYLVPERVADYIGSRGLYGASTSTPAPAA
jgi:nicotinate-nucleotide adenylyltransferase